MSGPTAPARDQIVTLVESTQVVGSPDLRNWDRREPLNAQAFRRFFVRVTSGSLSRLADAPNTANGGTVYLGRVYTVTCRWEALTRGTIGNDSNLITDDMERMALAIVRGAWDYNTTGIMKLEPDSWNVQALPNGEGIEADLNIDALIRRDL